MRSARSPITRTAGRPTPRTERVAKTFFWQARAETGDWTAAADDRGGPSGHYPLAPGEGAA